MKKKLESELISIAHRVLKLKNRSETIVLQQEAQKLYQQLTVLRFYEENFENFKHEISPEQLEEKVGLMSAHTQVETLEPKDHTTQTFQNNDTPSPIEEANEVQVVNFKTSEDNALELPDASLENDLEDATESISNITDQNISNTDEKSVNQISQLTLEELIGESYAEPEFIRVEEKKDELELFIDENEALIESKEQSLASSPQEHEKQELKTMSINDKLVSGINFGLNDRIAFEKKLFAGSSDDFNRVISQLNTFDSLDEATSFITDFVKPDYNDWIGQEEYEMRFIEIIEKKFN
ncbi:hypothetical protein [uncultured Flavobacterium sp.]|uniref:hypothetical protein n=1 Tax=uncultured Flavobacterium sp. TaxID=165435 RepID=UPI0030CA37FA|tara:strand:- start:3594 stop:4481 length:888 start_codon:yes stop_codon:yes gene_type:complete